MRTMLRYVCVKLAPSELKNSERGIYPQSEQQTSEFCISKVYSAVGALLRLVNTYKYLIETAYQRAARSVGIHDESFLGEKILILEIFRIFS